MSTSAALRHHAHADESAGSLRLASYNIRKAVGLDWRRDPGRILRVLAGLSADVVALQEADRRFGRRISVLDPSLLESATDLALVPLPRRAESIGWHGNAMLVRRGVTVQDAEAIELPGIEPRGAVIARLEGPFGPLTVAGVHLGLRRGCRRLQLKRIVDAVAAGGGPAVIVGDFNEWADLGGFDVLPDAFEIVAPGRSFHAARPVAPLDRLALSRELVVVRAAVEMEGEARIASDHLPIWADVALRRRD